MEAVNKENNISLLTLARTSDKIPACCQAWLVKGGTGDERERFYLPYESQDI